MYGDRPDPVSAATAFVAAQFPDARAAFLGDGVLGPARTPTSDLDVVVVLGPATDVPGRPSPPYRETFEHAGWITEAFVHDEESLRAWWARDAARRVPSLIRMVGRSVVLLDAAGVAERLRDEAADLLVAGPPAPDAEELAARRYALTNLLDDMAGCDDDAELGYIAGAVLRDVGELALLVDGEWLGTGKGLPRRLAEHDADLLERLVNGHRHVVLYGDTAVLHKTAVDVLVRAGGALLVGYRAAGAASPSPR
ncbi:MAG TPA: hypothetical protein VFV40_09505 [Nocardioides sp.]|nr:hypothetical protein [Nocardioides sp.]